MVKIYIDPGHGGSDPGAVGNGLREKTLTLQIATRIKDILITEYSNVQVRMSRTVDSTRSLAQRTNDANAWGADFFLSVHINAGGGTGFEDFIYPGAGKPSTTYQSNIHAEIMKLVDYKDRGRKTASYYVLKESNMPALLTENGFIDTAADAKKLKSASFIEALARGHVNGIAKSFNLKKKSTAVYHTVVQGDTVYALSQTYGSTVTQIKNWNALPSDYSISVGQLLRVK